MQERTAIVEEKKRVAANAIEVQRCRDESAIAEIKEMIPINENEEEIRKLISGIRLLLSQREAIRNEMIHELQNYKQPKMIDIDEELIQLQAITQKFVRRVEQIREHSGKEWASTKSKAMKNFSSRYA